MHFDSVSVCCLCVSDEAKVIFAIKWKKVLRKNGVNQASPSVHTQTTTKISIHGSINFHANAFASEVKESRIRASLKPHKFLGKRCFSVDRGE